MSRRKLLGLGILLASCFGVVSPAAAQLTPAQTDPLARMRAAANSQSQVCTVNEPSACAAATPKIVASALGPSPLAENMRHLAEFGARDPKQAVAWSMTAFRQAGVDEVHTEEVDEPAGAKSTVEHANVIAEIRGREKPDEFVILGARLGAESPANAWDTACNTALVIEAARDIHMSGLRPLRSIRFVIFSAGTEAMPASSAYVHAHRAELDRAIAAVIFDQGCGRVNGFSLGGRPDIESGVRETFAVPPVDSWDIGHHTIDAPLRADNFDFLLEGVPNLLPNREVPKQGLAPDPDAKVDLSILQHNTAVAGVLAFALAEHPTRIGPRLSRPEVAVLLKNTGLDAQMKAANLWPDWESARRGRLP